MAKHRVAVQEASVPELRPLGYWYALAGHTVTDVDGLIAGALRANPRCWIAPGDEHPTRLADRQIGARAGSA